MAVIVAVWFGFAPFLPQLLAGQAPGGAPPRPGPLAGLTRPIPRHIVTPQDIPPYFCSTLERWQWYVQHFESEWLEAAENTEDAFHYRAQVSARAAAHFVKDGDAATQKILDAEERWADKNAMSHLKARDDADQTRAKILGAPVIDCSSKSLASLIAQQQGQIANLDAEIKATEKKIKAIDQGIEDILIENDLMDAYEHGVLWQVPPTTVEHHNILRYVYDAHQEQNSLERGLDQLLKRRADLQNQLNSTTKFAAGLTNAGDACVEQPRTANVSMTVTPVDQKPAPAGEQAPGSPLTPEQIKVAQEKGRDWAAADYETEWSSGSLSARYSMQYRLQTRFDSFLKNHPFAEQEKKSFADGYWTGYISLRGISLRGTDMTQVDPPDVPSQAGATSTDASNINIDPVLRWRRTAEAWINSGNPHLQRQGKSLAAQLDAFEKSRQGTQAGQSVGTQPTPSDAGRWYKVDGKISGLPASIQLRGFFTSALPPSFSWDPRDGSAPSEIKIDSGGNFNIDDIWSPGDFLKGPPPAPAKTDGNRKFSVDDLWSPADFLRGPPAGSAQGRIELQLGDDRWKMPVSPLRMSLRNLGQGDSTIYGWNSEEAATRATRTAPGQTFVVPDSFEKWGIKAFSMQGLTSGCKAFLNGLGATYSEPNLRRGVAPAPSLDPAHWPDGKPESPIFSLSGQP